MVVAAWQRFSGILLALASGSTPLAAASSKPMPYGKTQQGEPVEIFTLTNKNGVQVKIANYGGVIVSLLAPDRQGKLADVVLGYDQLASYEVPNGPYFGALVGRYANRIARGSFALDGKTYKLAINNGPNALHGGPHGFAHVVWHAQPRSEGDTDSLQLSYLSHDGEEGYPGNLKVQVTYKLTPANELVIDYQASTDKATVVNLTNHSYFNLNGAGHGDILDHEVRLAATHFTPVDAHLIPTGELRAVVGTPFDFRDFHTVGERLQASDEQLRVAGGYDHNFVVSGKAGSLRLAAEVYAPQSGRTLTVLTTEPGVQFYSGNFLDGAPGKNRLAYKKRYGLCLETQHYPDSPNHPAFPTTVLRPGETYTSMTVFRFGTRAPGATAPAAPQP